VFNALARGKTTRQNVVHAYKKPAIVRLYCIDSNRATETTYSTQGCLLHTGTRYLSHSAALFLHYDTCTISLREQTILQRSEL